MSSTLYSQTSEGVSSEKRPGQFFDAWIVSRELCIFETMDLSMVPSGKRDFSLLQQIDAVSPFKIFGHWVQWYKGHAAVWIWDRELQESLAKRFAPSGSVDVYPETSSVISEQDGCFGFRGLEGYFIQIWEDEKLIAETSWLDRPTDDEQATFFETHGFGGSYPIRDWSSVPVSSFFDPIQSIKKNFVEKLISPALTLCLITGLVFQSVAFFRLTLALSEIEDQIQTIQKEKYEVVELRSSARGKLTDLKNLSMLAKPTQIELMSLLAFILEEESNSLIEWVYESGRIEALFASPRSSPAEIVERLEKTAYFSSISLEIDAVKGRVRIIMDMAPNGT